MLNCICKNIFNLGGKMKKGGVLILGLIILMIFYINPAIIQAEPEIPPVIINELAWAGSSSSSQDEWIELFNTTDEDIDLTGWQIIKDTSGDGSNETLVLEIEENLEDLQANILVASGYFLIANNDHEHDFGDDKLSVLNVEPNYIASSITLSNSNLSIKLYDGQWDNGREIVDTAGDGGIPLAGSNSAKTSMERNEIYNLGNLADSWHEATIATNLDDGVFDKATPQTQNSFPLLEPPTVISVAPNTAEIGTIFEIEEIEGENFVTEGVTQIQLQKDAIIISATEVHVASKTIVDQARFNLSGAQAGEWDLIVINPDTQEGTLPNAILLTEPEEEIIYSNNIIISELYPKPDTSSNDEFIELYNTGTSSINLKGWKLDDKSPGGSAEHVINQDLIIQPNEYLSFDKPTTHISLNDTGDYARLIQPDDTVLDETPNYETAKKGYSYSLIDNQWQWSLRVTKNQPNILELPEEEEEPEIENIEIELDFDDVSSTSVLLVWEIDPVDIISNVAIYQSEEEEKLGQLLITVASDDKEYLINDLSPATTYFFTLVGNYTGESIKSNQIELTTTTEIINNIGFPGQIIITEILPNPAIGEDEFIELYNPTEESVDIAGWRLVDASSKSYVINSLDLPPINISIMQIGSVIIPSKQYVLLEQEITGIHLNNSGGEELYLLDTDDNVIDFVSYDGSAKREYVYALAPNNNWFWSDETTPGEENDISFAGMNGNSTEYLTDSGISDLPSILLISLILSGIIFLWVKKHEYLYNN